MGVYWRLEQYFLLKRKNRIIKAEGGENKATREKAELEKKKSQKKKKKSQKKRKAGKRSRAKKKSKVKKKNEFEFLPQIITGLLDYLLANFLFIYFLFYIQFFFLSCLVISFEFFSSYLSFWLANRVVLSLILLCQSRLKHLS